MNLILHFLFSIYYAKVSTILYVLIPFFSYSVYVYYFLFWDHLVDMNINIFLIPFYISLFSSAFIYTCYKLRERYYPALFNPTLKRDPLELVFGAVLIDLVMMLYWMCVITFIYSHAYACLMPIFKLIIYGVFLVFQDLN
jgi:hypothetical protein